MRLRHPLTVAAGIVLVLALAGCSGHDLPTAPSAGTSGKSAATTDPVQVGNFVVSYLGSTFDGQATTFRWNVAGTGEEPDLHWFLVELPECAPAPTAWEPTEGGIFYELPAYGISGFKWILAVDAQDLVGRQYALTFPGEVAEGTVHTVLSTAAGTTLGEIPGPCAGAVETFELAGTVFSDADEDGVRDATDGGIPDVLVEIVSAAGTVETVLTDADGRWSVRRAAGDYTVRIDTAAHPEAFNATLDELFVPTTPLESAVSVGPDAGGIDFGFAPDTGRIIADLEQGVILADGEPLTFWLRQLYVAFRMSSGGDDKPYVPKEGYYSPDRLLQFIAAIEVLYLPEPYTFADGNELQDAYAQLRRYPRNPVEKLYRELLVSEFNHVSGRGLYGVDPALQGVLIAWGETLLADALAEEGKAAADKADTGKILDAAAIFRGINTGGGGGIDE